MKQIGGFGGGSVGTHEIRPTQYTPAQIAAGVAQEQKAEQQALLQQATDLSRYNDGASVLAFINANPQYASNTINALYANQGKKYTVLIDFFNRSTGYPYFFSVLTPDQQSDIFSHMTNVYQRPLLAYASQNGQTDFVNRIESSPTFKAVSSQVTTGEYDGNTVPFNYCGIQGIRDNGGDGYVKWVIGNIKFFISYYVQSTYSLKQTDIDKNGNILYNLLLKITSKNNKPSVTYDVFPIQDPTLFGNSGKSSGYPTTYNDILYDANQIGANCKVYNEGESNTVTINVTGTSFDSSILNGKVEQPVIDFLNSTRLFIDIQNDINTKFGL